MGKKRDRTSMSSSKKEKKEAKRLKKEKRKSKSSAETPVATSSSFTPFTLERVVALASLLPSELKDVTKSAENLVGLDLLRYSSVMGGVLLAYDKLVILNDGKGRIIGDLPYSHFKIQYEALLFTPKVGKRLRGIVTKSFSSHISIAVYHFFHASIQADVLNDSGYEWDEESEEWQVPSEEGVKTISIDTPISFVVDKIHEAGGILSLSASEPMPFENYDVP